MQNLTDQTLGRYHLIEPLGEGGMAVVYKAFDTRLECEVAVKIIRIENLPLSGVERALKRFEREAKSVARLNHANILKVMDYGEQDGSPYLVMPYLPGGTLKELVKQRGQIPWREAAQLLLPIAEALGYAHSQGVIHRDIKPSNILLTESGQPMLTDFGVAKIIEDEATQDLTSTSATVGTPEYMAPEQITSKTVDARADLYSLGVVFYEMVTGRKPYTADTPMAVMIMHSRDPLPRPSQFVKSLPKNVEYFLLKALTKKPEDRYQSSTDMIKALHNTMSGSKVERIQSVNIDIFPKKETLSFEKKQVIRRIGLIILGLTILIGFIILIGIRIGKPTIPVFTTTVTEEFSRTSTITPTITIKPTLTITSGKTTLQTTSISKPTMTQPQSMQTSENISGKINSTTNCRYGPGSIYTTIYILDEGINANVFGISQNKQWINIEIDQIELTNGQTLNNCWVSSSNIEIEKGEIIEPIFTPAPIYTKYKVTLIFNKDYSQVFELNNPSGTESSIKAYYQNYCDNLNHQWNNLNPCTIILSSPTYSDEIYIK